MKTLALLAALLLVPVPSLAADAPRAERPLLLPPRDPHPFGAIETRPLWERPPHEPLTLQQRVEDALDRGTGRIEDQTLFDLRQIERDQAAAAGGRFGDLDGRSELDRFREQRERHERLDQRRWRLEQARRRARIIERESETLAEVRRRFAEQADRADLATGAVVDRQLLQGVEQEYRQAIELAAKRHAAELAAIAADATLTPEQRAARRAAADEQLEQARITAARRWEQRRAEVLGVKE